jgi:hypothetical protein
MGFVGTGGGGGGRRRRGAAALFYLSLGERREGGRAAEDRGPEKFSASAFRFVPLVRLG